MTVSVTVPSLNVRSAPSTTAPLAGSQTLSTGDQFTATSEVTGESVSGNDQWWVSSAGNYVWSGGTNVASGAGTGVASGYDFATAKIGGLASPTFRYLAFKTSGSVSEVEAYDSSGAKIKPVNVDLSPGSAVSASVLTDGDTSTVWPGPLVNQLTPGSRGALERHWRLEPMERS